MTVRLTRSKTGGTASTESSGTGRTLGAPETYGVLDTAWTAPASAPLLSSLPSLQPATQGP